MFFSIQCVTLQLIYFFPLHIHLNEMYNEVGCKLIDKNINISSGPLEQQDNLSVKRLIASFGLRDWTGVFIWLMIVDDLYLMLSPYRTNCQFQRV